MECTRKYTCIELISKIWLLLNQAEAKRAKLDAAAKLSSGGNNALPSSRREQLSDAKLFQVHT
jgi:hypothetical protein